MNGSARNVEAAARNPEMVGGGVPAGNGLISRIGRLARRLARSEPRKTMVDEAARTGSGPGRDPAASRSTMDAGITGGMTLLIGGSCSWSRRR